MKCNIGGRDSTANVVILETCICGGCFDCPDGWHYDDDVPCSCTADCALEVDDE